MKDFPHQGFIFPAPVDLHTLILHLPNQPPRNLGHVSISEYHWLLHQLQRPPLPALNFRGFEFGVERFHIHSRWDEPTRIEIWGRKVAPGEAIETYSPGWAPEEEIALVFN